MTHEQQSNLPYTDNFAAKNFHKIINFKAGPITKVSLGKATVSVNASEIRKMYHFNILLDELLKVEILSICDVRKGSE